MAKTNKKGKGAKPLTAFDTDPYGAGPLADGVKLVPSCVYFYYIGPDPNNYPYVREYYYSMKTGELSKAGLKTELVKLTQNARNRMEADQVPPPTGADWGRMVWTRKSYIVILIDDPSFVFEKPAVAFNTNSYNTQPNHSFYDAWNDRIDAPLSGGSSRMCPMVGFINHMVTETWTDLDEVAERFHFCLLTTPKLTGTVPPPTSARGYVPYYPDSGGTNMGPPVPPP